MTDESLVDLFILPLRSLVLFPGSIVPIGVGRKGSLRLIEECIRRESPVIGVLTQREARTEDPGGADLYAVGCAARILKVIKLGDEHFSVVLEGINRIRAIETLQRDPFFISRVQSVPCPNEPDVELDALALDLKDTAKRVVRLMPELPEEAPEMLDAVGEPGELADLITAATLDIATEEKQEVLETIDVRARLHKVLAFLSRQLEVLGGGQGAAPEVPSASPPSGPKPMPF